MSWFPTCPVPMAALSHAHIYAHDSFFLSSLRVLQEGAKRFPVEVATTMADQTLQKFMECKRRAQKSAYEAAIASHKTVVVVGNPSSQGNRSGSHASPGVNPPPPKKTIDSVVKGKRESLRQLGPDLVDGILTPNRVVGIVVLLCMGIFSMLYGHRYLNCTFLLVYLLLTVWGSPARIGPWMFFFLAGFLCTAHIYHMNWKSFDSVLERGLNVSEAYRHDPDKFHEHVSGPFVYIWGLACDFASTIYVGAEYYLAPAAKVGSQVCAWVGEYWHVCTYLLAEWLFKYLQDLHDAYGIKAEREKQSRLAWYTRGLTVLVMVFLLYGVDVISVMNTLACKEEACHEGCTDTLSLWVDVPTEAQNRSAAYQHDFKVYTHPALRDFRKTCVKAFFCVLCMEVWLRFIVSSSTAPRWWDVFWVHFLCTLASAAAFSFHETMISSSSDTIAAGFWGLFFKKAPVLEWNNGILTVWGWVTFAGSLIRVHILAQIIQHNRVMYEITVSVLTGSALLIVFWLIAWGVTRWRVPEDILDEWVDSKLDKLVESAEQLFPGSNVALRCASFLVSALSRKFGSSRRSKNKKAQHRPRDSDDDDDESEDEYQDDDIDYEDEELNAFNRAINNKRSKKQNSSNNNNKKKKAASARRRKPSKPDAEAVQCEKQLTKSRLQAAVEMTQPFFWFCVSMVSNTASRSLMHQNEGILNDKTTANCAALVLYLSVMCTLVAAHSHAPKGYRAGLLAMFYVFCLVANAKGRLAEDIVLRFQQPDDYDDYIRNQYNHTSQLNSFDPNFPFGNHTSQWATDDPICPFGNHTSQPNAGEHKLKWEEYTEIDPCVNVSSWAFFQRFVCVMTEPEEMF